MHPLILESDLAAGAFALVAIVAVYLLDLLAALRRR
jgi:hypothetical protein